jgi:hypothetical protein
MESNRFLLHKRDFFVIAQLFEVFFGQIDFEIVET